MKMKKEIVDLIKKEKIITIIRGVDKEHIVPLCEALYNGGIRLAEITFDPTGRTPPAQTAEMISLIAEKFSGKLHVGAGTVLNIDVAQTAHKAGAEYLISPNVDIEVIKFCSENGIAAIPGAMTPTEIVNAYNAGADFVKVFPVDSLGVSYLKAVKAPLSHIPMLAVGGVDADNITDYMSTGVSGVGIGSKLVNPKYIKSGKYDEITAVAKILTEKIKNI